MRYRGGPQSLWVEPMVQQVAGKRQEEGREGTVVLLD